MRDVRGLVVAACVVCLALGALALVGAAISASGSLLPGGLLFLIGVILVVILLNDPFRSSVRSRAKALASGHHLTFTVGLDERHEVDYRWDQVWGWVTVTVDGELILRQLVTFTFRLTRVDEFEVGTGEKHTVRVEKTRPLVAAGVRTQPLVAYVDGILLDPWSGSSA